MSINKFGQAGFGIGAWFGVPVTVAVNTSATVTLTGTAYAAGQQYLSSFQPAPTLIGNDVALVTWKMITTTNGVTGTYSINSGGAGLHFYNDNTSYSIVNLSSVSVNICLIPT